MADKINLMTDLEVDFETTPATQGIEYEEDPIAQELIGDLGALETSTQENLVTSINELVKKIGDLDNLNTEDTSKIVNAINELLDKIGNTDILVTEDNSNLVSAINELKTSIGNLNNLNTENKTSIVNAINELCGGGDDNVVFQGSVPIGGLTAKEICSTTKDILNKNLRVSVARAGGSIQVINLFYNGEFYVGGTTTDFGYSSSSYTFDYTNIKFQCIQTTENDITTYTIQGWAVIDGFNISTKESYSQAGYGVVKKIEIIK